MVNDDLQLIVNILGGMEERFNQKFDAIDKKFDAIDKKFDAIDRRLDAMEERFNQKFDAIDERFGAIDKKFDAIDKRLAAMDERFDAIDKKLGAIDERFENTDKVILQCYQDTVQLIEREYNKTEMLIPKVNDLEKWIVDVEVVATRAQAETAAVKKVLIS